MHSIFAIVFIALLCATIAVAQSSSSSDEKDPEDIPEACLTLNSTNGIECNGHGRCVNNSRTDYQFKCRCFDKYAKDDCSYKRKSQKTAFGVTWVYLGCICGVERFYLGYTGIGVTFLLLGLLATGMGCASCFSLLGGKSGFFIFLRVLTACAGVAIFAIWIYELVIIGKGQLKDANGFEMHMDM